MIATHRPETGTTTTGVPFVVVPPEGGARPEAPVVVGWHLLDAPCSEAAFQAALPLAGLDAWRVYLGLPLSGSRLPEGGFEEVMRRGYTDAVMLLHGPINAQAADESDAALAELGERFGFGRGPVGVLGGSAGAGVALEVMTRRGDVAAAVLVSPVVSLRPVVDALAVQFGFAYPWAAESEAVAARMDYLARAGELGSTPVRLVVGEGDVEAVHGPAAALPGALTGPADVVTVAGMGHALADEPGLEPAPQTPHAAEVDAHAVAWFREHLGA